MGPDGNIQDIVVIIEELRAQLGQSRELNRSLQTELDKTKSRCETLRELADAKGLRSHGHRLQ